tara:strand:+ start:1263 stop:2030 length:768 start_codon:yes stop_codon:yes gene_type:complete
MKIIVITQNEPFYLTDNLKYLINILPKNSQIVGAVVSKPSPFGRKGESFLQKTLKTFHIFGLKFFTHYSLMYIKNYFDQSKKIENVLNKYDIDKIVLNKSINHKDSIEKIKSYKPDILISILGNEIFKKPIINLAPYGCLNLHSALLPKYRGLMPTFWVLKNNEEFTGVSVFFVDEGIDSGPIIVQKKIKINDLSQKELIILTKKIGMEAIAEAVDKISKNKVNLIDNNDSEKTYFSFPKKSDVKEFYNSGKRFF